METNDCALGQVVAEDPGGTARLYVTAIFGDGGLILGWGEWGDLGMIQMLGVSVPAASMGEAFENGTPEAKQMMDNADRGGGMMLLFRSPECIDRLIAALGKVRNLMTAKESASVNRGRP